MTRLLAPNYVFDRAKSVWDFVKLVSFIYRKGNPGKGLSSSQGFQRQPSANHAQKLKISGLLSGKPTTLIKRYKAANCFFQAGTWEEKIAVASTEHSTSLLRLWKYEYPWAEMRLWQFSKMLL